MQRMSTRTIWPLLLLSLLAAGCSSLPRDFERQASTVKAGQSVILLVQRGDATTFLAIKPKAEAG